MATWKRKPQERNDQKYFFSGKFYFTKGVFHALSFDEIVTIYNDVRQFAQEKDGIDYLQVYTNENEQKLFFIDSLSRCMIESGEYQTEHNYCTLMLAEEY